VRAELINSTLSGREKQDILHELRYFSGEDENAIKFLYIAPERLNSNEFLGILKTVKIAAVAIDEAHCISQWGHDFRPSYMKIKWFLEELSGQQRNFPVIGLTATATLKVRKDIVERLGLKTYKEFISGFDRKNIILVVREISAKDEKQKKVHEIIEKTP
jgi:ATP-dependent DNA helicase RecQ